MHGLYFFSFLHITSYANSVYLFEANCLTDLTNWLRHEMLIFNSYAKMLASYSDTPRRRSLVNLVNGQLFFYYISTCTVHITKVDKNVVNKRGFIVFYKPSWSNQPIASSYIKKFIYFVFAKVQ